MPTSSVIPSFSNGFATHMDESDAPEQWSGNGYQLVGLYAPGLGFQGQTLYDWSGYGLHATLGNVTLATCWAAGARGTQLTLGSLTTQYASVGNQTIHNFGAGITFAISIWMRASHVNGKFLVSKRSTAGFSVNSNASTLLFRCDEGAANVDVTGTVNPLDGNWHHLMLGRTRTAVYQYLDGVPNGSTSSTSLGNLTDTNPLCIGQSNVGNSESWGGDIGEVRLYRGDVEPQAMALAIVSDPYALLRRRQRTVRRTAGATQYNLSVAGGLTPAGALNRQSGKVLTGTL